MLATWKFKWLEALIEGRPTPLVHNGKMDEAAMNRHKVTHHELLAALRAVGCSGIDQVHVAVLENTGRISVLMRTHPHEPEAPPAATGDQPG